MQLLSWVWVVLVTLMGPKSIEVRPQPRGSPNKFHSPGRDSLDSSQRKAAAIREGSDYFRFHDCTRVSHHQFLGFDQISVEIIGPLASSKLRFGASKLTCGPDKRAESTRSLYVALTSIQQIFILGKCQAARYCIYSCALTRDHRQANRNPRELKCLLGCIVHQVTFIDAKCPC